MKNQCNIFRDKEGI